MNPLGLSGNTERRSDPRLKVKFSVYWAREQSPEREAEVTDLSSGGCFVHSYEEVQEGDLVKLRFDIPGYGDLTAWGNIVYRLRRNGFGVRFSALSQGGSQDKLATILDGEFGRQ